MPILISVAVIVAVLVVAVALLGSRVPAAPSGTARPAADETEAFAKLAELEARETAEVAGACVTRVVRAVGVPRGTIILWHGFTNCPAQFSEVAEILGASGYCVLLARMPRHGLADTLTRSLQDLSVHEVVDFGHACVDIAAGLPAPVSAVGFSVGGTLAAWAGASRVEVQRVVAMSPMIEPVGLASPLGRLLVRARGLVPGIYFWWDPRKKESLGESPFVYPGFPLPSLLTFVQLGESLRAGSPSANHRLARVALVSNPGDFAIRRDVARDTISRAFASHAERTVELTLEKSLGWWHDFVDQHGPRHGTPEQVAALIVTALGDGDDPSAGGVVARTEPLSSA